MKLLATICLATFCLTAAGQTNTTRPQAMTLRTPHSAL